MKISALILLLLLSVNSFSQGEPLYTMSGNFYQSSVTRGGGAAYWEDLDMVYPNLKPMANRKLVIVRFNDSDSVPTIYSEVTSDSTGYFEILLSSGKYGFIEVSDQSAVLPGQYLPKSYSSIMNHMSYSSSWEISTNGPVDLTKGSKSDIILYHHSSSYCIDCP